jgi:ankyrin repeat protein
MPKKNQKSNQQRDEVADDFDDMLAGFRAADLANASSSHVAPNTASAVPSDAARAQAPGVIVAEAAILAAIEAGDLNRLRRWHRQGVRYSVHIVCMAARSGSIALIRCLVEELGADVNGANDDNGVTPLMVACLSEKLHLVRYLVRTLGADVDKADAAGESPLFSAAQEGLLNMVWCLLKEFGADVNQASCQNVTPLMIAAKKGHVAVVQCLGREHGANINKADHHGFTALFGAAGNGHLNVVQCLIEEFGVKVNQRAHNGGTPLMIASFRKHDKVVKWLLKHGADAQASTTSYRTAIDASRAGGAPIAQTEYLEAKAHCSNPGCSGAGLKKCTGCKQARYCGQSCQLAHWKAHKADCKLKT